MRTTKTKDDLSKAQSNSRQPNPAVKAVRQALNMNQAQFAKFLGTSQSYVASLEIGRYPTTRDIAFQLAGRTGVNVSCVLRHNPKPMDTWGHTYSEISYRAFQEARPHKLTKDEMNKFVSPIEIILTAAAEAGRLHVFDGLLRHVLQELVETVDGVKKSFTKLSNIPHPKIKTFTYGYLREKRAFAKLIGFQDDPRRHEGEIAKTVHNMDAADFSSPLANPSYGDDNTLILQRRDTKGKPKWKAVFSGKPLPTQLAKAKKMATDAQSKPGNPKPALTASAPTVSARKNTRTKSKSKLKE